TLLFVLKPQHSLPFLLFLAGARRWKVFPSFIACLSILTVLALVQIGFDGFAGYLELLRDPGSISHQQPELTPTIRGQLLRLFPDQDRIIFSVTSFLSGLLLLLAMFWGHMLKGRESWLWTGIVVLIPVTIVLSVHCHMYDLLIMTPSMVLLFQDRGIRTS